MILIVVDSIDPEDSSGSKVNVAFISNLKKAGYEVKVLTLNKAHNKNLQLGELLVEPIKNLNYFLSRVQRVFQRYVKIDLSLVLENRFGFSFTFFNECQSLQKELEQLDTIFFELIITLSKGESFRPHYAVLHSLKWHTKWLAYIHDPYPFQNYPEPYRFIPKGAAQKHRFFKKLAVTCRFAGFPSQYLADHMANFYGDFLTKQVIIPHQYDSSFRIGALPSFFNKEMFNLVHAGNLIAGRSPEGLLKGFEGFLKINPEARGKSFLHLIGPSGSYSDLFEDFLEIEEFLPRPSVSYAEAVALQTHATVNLIIEASDSAYSPFLPAKMAHLVHADKPIFTLSPDVSEVRRLLGAEYSWQCRADDSEQITHIISNLYNQWKEIGHNMSLNRQDLQNYFSTSHLDEKIQFLRNEA
ncbi:UDP-glycosyltransferase [Leeuwenhoekiella sp. NPDC079379]|uniref:UDP-glycosyltransferase n=1 Tax=Leeuwenhoekiella sp. NPDC079379 TaxID=3364122 RepID=UPI0037C93538